MPHRPHTVPRQQIGPVQRRALRLAAFAAQREAEPAAVRGHNHLQQPRPRGRGRAAGQEQDEPPRRPRIHRRPGDILRHFRRLLVHEEALAQRDAAAETGGRV